MSVSVFVYGTLKRESPKEPHRLLRSATYLSRASIRGTLYDLGRYPGLIRGSNSDDRVFGELYQLSEDDASRALRRLDEYEGNEYERRRVYVTLPSGRRKAAWTYL